MLLLVKVCSLKCKTKKKKPKNSKVKVLQYRKTFIKQKILSIKLCNNFLPQPIEYKVERKQSTSE